MTMNGWSEFAFELDRLDAQSGGKDKHALPGWRKGHL